MSQPPRASSFPSPGPLTNANVNGRIVIASLALLCFVVLLILALHIYAKFFWRRAQLRQVALWRQHLHVSVMQQAIAAGLDKAAIDSLPTFIFKFSQRGAMDCPVCLSELQEEDEGKILPKCSHSFHAKCIDMWLLAHATCPLCRMSAHAADSGPSSDANADELELTVVHAEVPLALHSSNAEDGDAEALPSPGWRWRRSISDRFSQSMHTGVEFPTNVLFWGNHSHVSSRTNPAREPAPHMALDITRPTQALMAARSSSSRPGDPCPSWHAERQGKAAAAGLSVFRRLLSGERKIFPAEQETSSCGESVTEMLQK